MNLRSHLNKNVNILCYIKSMELWDPWIIAIIDNTRVNKEIHQRLYKSTLLVKRKPESIWSQNIVSEVQLNPVRVVCDVLGYTGMCHSSKSVTQNCREKKEWEETKLTNTKQFQWLKIKTIRQVRYLILNVHSYVDANPE